MRPARGLTSKPSSTAFVVKLSPCSARRRWILGVGWLLCLTGLVLILNLPLPVAGRAVLAVAWIAQAVIEILGTADAQRDVCKVTIGADGRIDAWLKSGQQESLSWLADGLILKSLVWLRFRRANRRHYCELFLRRDVDPETWRRLQVIGRFAGLAEAEGHE